MKILKTILSWFNSESIEKKVDEREYEWCIVGNIINEHYWGEEKIIKRGTKHFRPGAKVYCLPEFAGMAHESIRVIGKPRKQNRLINVVIPTNLIKNFRVQKVFHPKIQFDIGSHIFYWSNRRTENELKELEALVMYLNTLTQEINK